MSPGPYPCCCSETPPECGVRCLPGTSPRSIQVTIPTGVFQENLTPDTWRCVSECPDVVQPPDPAIVEGTWILGRNPNPPFADPDGCMFTGYMNYCGAEWVPSPSAVLNCGYVILAIIYFPGSGAQIRLQIELFGQTSGSLTDAPVHFWNVPLGPLSGVDCVDALTDLVVPHASTNPSSGFPFDVATMTPADVLVQPSNSAPSLAVDWTELPSCA